MANSASYPKILAIGDKAIAELYDDEVEITEKVDGSQFGFGIIDGQLVCRSKGKELDLDNPDQMFKEAVDYVKSIESRLPEGRFFYAEYLRRPRHSTLAYDRIPQNHLMLFGVHNHDNSVSKYGVILRWADELGIEAIPLLYRGKSDPEHTLSLMGTTSVLGGQEIEGVVVKRFKDWLFLGRLLYPIMSGKYVTEKFKEVHRQDWKRLNTSKGGFDHFAESFKTEARWHKAVMHLKERGEYEGSVRDIGNLIEEVRNDIIAEEKENIKDQLWKIYSKDILRTSTSGLPEWFKQGLAKGDFDADG